MGSRGRRRKADRALERVDHRVRLRRLEDVVPHAQEGDLLQAAGMGNGHTQEDLPTGREPDTVGRPGEHGGDLLLHRRVGLGVGRAGRRAVTGQVDGGDDAVEVTQDVHPSGLLPVVLEGGGEPVQEHERRG
jgi:hypothetical protein